MIQTLWKIELKARINFGMLYLGCLFGRDKPWAERVRKREVRQGEMVSHVHGPALCCAELDEDRHSRWLSRWLCLAPWSSPDGLCAETMSQSSWWVRGKKKFVCLAPTHLLFPPG